MTLSAFIHWMGREAWGGFDCKGSSWASFQRAEASACTGEELNQQGFWELKCSGISLDTRPSEGTSGSHTLGPKYLRRLGVGILWVEWRAKFESPMPLHPCISWIILSLESEALGDRRQVDLWSSLAKQARQIYKLRVYWETRRATVDTVNSMCMHTHTCTHTKMYIHHIYIHTVNNKYNLKYF